MAAHIQQLSLSSSHELHTAFSQYHICIGVCTRRRPDMLTDLLKSLETIKVPDATRVTVCVVENDDEPRNRELVNQLNESSALSINYLLETRVGIPQARNCLIDHAFAIHATALVLIDDDEQVTPSWLLNLFNYADATDWAAVIQGHVESVMENETCHDLLPFFQRRRRSTGEPLSSCASNNTLVPMALIKKCNLRFDENRSLQGGSDTIFFSKANSMGIPLLYCSEAVVKETIPSSRANIRWLSMRKFRVGLLMGSGLVSHKKRSPLRMLFHSLRGLVGLCVSLLLLVAREKESATRAWLSSCKSIGCSLGFFRVQVQPYRQIDGH